MNPKNFSLSIVAICKNEEQDMEAFLQNVLPLADEVIIVDDGSTDSSRSIANAYGDKIIWIDHPRTDEEGFGGQRNVGIEAANSEWVINMDIDERISPELFQEMCVILPNTELNAFKYRRSNFFLHREMKGGNWTSWNQPQLARRLKHIYVNKVHEKAVVEGQPASIGQLSGKMWHINDADYSERLRKSFQYCHIDAQHLVESGTTVTALKIFTGPITEFLKQYVFKKGFRDGVPGLISAMHSAGATFRTLALAWDHQNRIARQDIEKSFKDEWNSNE